FTACIRATRIIIRSRCIWSITNPEDRRVRTGWWPTGGAGRRVALAVCGAVAVTSCGAATSGGRHVPGYRVAHVVNVSGLNPRALTAARPVVVANSDAGESVSTLSVADGHRVAEFRFGA